MAIEKSFYILIEKVQTQDIEKLAAKFADLLLLKEDIARLVINASPIAIAQGLSKQDVKYIMPKLVELSKEGIEFRITSNLSKKVPKIFLSGSIISTTEKLTAVSFDWNGLVFVCPSCKEIFIFKRLGRPEPEQKKEGLPQEIKEELYQKKLIKDLSEVEPFIEDSEPFETEETTPQDLTPSPTPQPDTIVEHEEEEEEIKIDKRPEVEKEHYNVFVPQVKDEEKRQQIEQILTEIRRCSHDEAKRLTKRIIIPVAKGVSKKDAQKILSKFKKLNITGRMIRVQKNQVNQQE